MTEQEERDRFTFALGFIASHGINLENRGISDADGLATSFTRAFECMRDKFPSITEPVLTDVLKNCSFKQIMPIVEEIIRKASKL